MTIAEWYTKYDIKDNVGMNLLSIGDALRELRVGIVKFMFSELGGKLIVIGSGFCNPSNSIDNIADSSKEINGTCKQLRYTVQSEKDLRESSKYLEDTSEKLMHIGDYLKSSVRNLDADFRKKICTIGDAICQAGQYLKDNSDLQLAEISIRKSKVDELNLKLANEFDIEGTLLSEKAGKEIVAGLGLIEETSVKTDLLALKKRLVNGEVNPQTEEATKQWLVMPLLAALGYDPWSSDIVPEYTLDVGVKQGEKVDYALQIDGKTVAIIECKQFRESLSERHISQLYRYFSVTDAKIGILTNGDDYWFFTDSAKENVMDLNPYLSFKLSTASETEISSLLAYHKANILSIDIKKDICNKRLESACKELINNIKVGTFPSWVYEHLSAEAGLKDANIKLAEKYLLQEVGNAFKSPVNSMIESSNILGVDDNLESKENTTPTIKKPEFKLNHWYVYNDYSAGGWAFHKPNKVQVFDMVTNISFMYELLTETVNGLVKQGLLDKAKVVQSGAFTLNKCRLTENAEECRQRAWISSLGMYCDTCLSSGGIVKSVQYLLKFCNLPDETVKVSFRA